MTPLKIAAVSTMLLPAGTAPTPLRASVQAEVRDPPRRISRLIELALLGAHRCMKQQRPEPRCPLYLALTHGCVADAVALVQTVSSGGLPTPVAFINVSSNMAGFYVASTLGIHGSNQAVAADDFSFEAALELASLGREHRAQGLIGAVEECAWPLTEHRVRLGLPPDAALAEASHWLFIDQNAASPLATVQWVRRYPDESDARAALAREQFPQGTLRSGNEPEKFHSGQRTAHRICGFIESGSAPGLLHLSQGRSGCYAVYVTR
jgi:hypothetical protein